MIARRKILLAMLAWMAITVRESDAQVTEASIVQAMKNLGLHWQARSRLSDTVIAACKGNAFMAIRLAPGAVVNVDLQRTTSLMNPYLGIVQIRGRFQRNDSQQDGSCSKTLLEAKRNMNWRDNDRDFDLAAYYQSNGSELVLSGGNEVFQNSFFGLHGPFQFEPGSPWNAIFRFPIQQQ